MTPCGGSSDVLPTAQASVAESALTPSSWTPEVTLDAAGLTAASALTAASTTTTANANLRAKARAAGDNNPPSSGRPDYPRSGCCATAPPGLSWESGPGRACGGNCRRGTSWVGRPWGGGSQREAHCEDDARREGRCG